MAGQNGASGITGRVFLGPTCPVERVGSPCARPYQATVGIYTGNGSRRITTFRSGSDGRFRVRLPAGRYRLENTHSGLPRLQPVRVAVKAHRYTAITLRFDTGIR